MKKEGDVKGGVFRLFSMVIEKYSKCDIFSEYFIGISSNGRTEAFEAFNWGSNPCIPADF